MIVTVHIQHSRIVSEPIAIELRQASGNVYLHAQIFTGCMYVAAALCMWFLRAWKIGEIGKIAAAQEKPLENIDALASQLPEGLDCQRSDSAKSNLVSRLVMWKRV